MIEVKQRAPYFELHNQANEIVCLDDYKGQRLYIFFCGYVKDDLHTKTIIITYIQALQRFHDVGVQVLGVFGNSVKDLKEHGEILNVPFPMLFDEHEMMRKAYGVYTNKMTFGKNYVITTRCGLIIDENGFVERVFKRITAEQYAEPVIGYLEHKQQKEQWRALSRRTKERIRREAKSSKSEYIGPLPRCIKKVET